MRSIYFGEAALYVGLAAFAPVSVAAQAQFLRGDTDGNDAIDIGDAVRVLVDRFGGLSLITCEDAADVNDDGAVDITDPIYLLRHLFLGSPAPPPPSRECGDDPTDDDLGCASTFNNCFPCEDGCVTPAVCILTSTGEALCTAHLTTCEQVRAAYDFIVQQLTSPCDGATGCRVEPGHCTIGLGFCYYFASNHLPPEYLPALALRFQELGCVDPDHLPCECPRPPEVLECIDGSCSPAF